MGTSGANRCIGSCAAHALLPPLSLTSTPCCCDCTGVRARIFPA